MTLRNADTRARMVKVVSELLGEPVRSLDMPGGDARSSARVILKDRTVIATKRANFRRTHLEAAVLSALSPHCAHVPRFLGLKDNVLVQSDVGGQRLSELIWAADPVVQKRLAEQAIVAILEIHAASREALKDVPVPPLGATEAWVNSLVASSDILESYDAERVPTLDRDAVAAALTQAPRQFLKWDCRAGNAAQDTSGTLCWFDFEYCGMRHGAEDLAWLIADESWPLSAADMFEIVAHALPQYGVTDVAGYLDYLALYTTFHSLQRLTLIEGEVSRRGWRSKSRIIARDDVGRHPEFAAHLCETGMFCAEWHPLAQPLRRGFKRAARAYASLRVAQRRSPAA